MPLTPDQVDAVNDLLNVLEKSRGYMPHLKLIHDACWDGLIEINNSISAETALQPVEAGSVSVKTPANPEPTEPNPRRI
jgi:hypothetical protein